MSTRSTTATRDPVRPRTPSLVRGRLPGRGAPVTEPERTHDLDRWMGDGGMPIIGALGASFEGFEPGSVRGTWTPTDLACSHFGNAQAGIHAVVLDAAMSLATLSALPTSKRAVTSSITVNHHRPALLGKRHDLRAEAVRVGGWWPCPGRGDHRWSSGQHRRRDLCPRRATRATGSVRARTLPIEQERVRTLLITRAQVAAGVTLLTLNRPDKMNALNAEIVQELHDLIAAIRTDQSCRVVILTGEGRGFSAGLDLGGYGSVPGEGDSKGRVQAAWAMQVHIAGVVAACGTFPNRSSPPSTALRPAADSHSALGATSGSHRRRHASTSRSYGSAFRGATWGSAGCYPVSSACPGPGS